MESNQHSPDIPLFEDDADVLMSMLSGLSPTELDMAESAHPNPGIAEGSAANTFISFPTFGMSSQAPQSTMIAGPNILCTMNGPATHYPQQISQQINHGSEVDPSNGGSQLNQPGQRETMHFSMHRQLFQGEPSQDPQQTKSGKRKPPIDDEKEINRIRSQSYRVNDKVEKITLQHKVAKYEENYPEPSSSQRPSFSAPEGRSLSFDDLRKAKERRDSLAELYTSLKASTSCPQPHGPFPAQARQNTIEQIHYPDHSSWRSEPYCYQRKGKHERESRADSLDQLNDLQLSNDVQCPPRNSEGVVFTGHLSQNHDNYGAAGAVSELLDKINANSNVTVGLLDFPDLDTQAENIKVGKYNFPKSLECIAKKIESEKGDVTADCNMPNSVKQEIIVLFCASIEEMENQKLEEVTEDKILKWGTTINYALDLNFRVEFARKHLKEVIVPDYIEVKALEEKWKVLQEDIERLNGKPVGMGLFKKKST